MGIMIVHGQPVPTGTSGHTIPYLDGANTWSGTQSISMSGTGFNMLSLTTTDATATASPVVAIDRASVSPAASDFLADLIFYGRDSGANLTQYGSLVVLISDPTNGSEDSCLIFDATAAGATSEPCRMGGGIYYNAATGGDKGAGSANFNAVYDDNVLLTSAPLSQQFQETGTVDLAKWDAMIPGERTNETAAVFSAMVDGGFDPRDHTQFTTKLRADEVLPGMFPLAEWEHNKYSTGQLLSRLLLSSDIMATAVAGISDQVTDHEARIASLEATIASLQAQIQSLTTTTGV